MISSQFNGKKYKKSAMGAVAQFFTLKDDSLDSFRKEIVGGLVLYLTTCKYYDLLLNA